MAKRGELLAGKYKNAEDLEKAYVELQKKLGDKEEKEDTEASNKKKLLMRKKNLRKKAKLIH